jgi:nucleoside-diphosphate kinase
VCSGRNVIHASDSAESAAHEIALWFGADEVRDYELATIKWTSEKA